MTPLMAPVFNARTGRHDAINGAHGASDYIAPNAYVRQGRMNASPTIIVMTSDYVVPNAYVRQGRMNASPTLTVGAPLMAPVLMRVRNVMTPLMAPVFNARSERHDAINGARCASDDIVPNTYIRTPGTHQCVPHNHRRGARC